MIQKLKYIIAATLATVMVAAPILMPATVSAADATSSDPNTTVQNGLCQGANLKVGTDCTQVSDTHVQDTVNNTITWGINIFSIVVGIAAVIMIIVGGLRYIISGGDSGNVTSAKNTILYAIIGLVVVVLAQFVVRFILSKANSAAGN